MQLLQIQSLTTKLVLLGEGLFPVLLLINARGKVEVMLLELILLLLQKGVGHERRLGVVERLLARLQVCRLVVQGLLLLLKKVSGLDAIFVSVK